MFSLNLRKGHMLFTAPQTAPAAPLPGIIRPHFPRTGQSNEDDYDAAYLDARPNDVVGQEADLPLFSPVEKVTQVVTSSELLARCSQFLSRADVDRIRQAFMYADDAHLGQFRKSGEPYITHPLAVANILAEWRLDATTICAGLMHDVLEDTKVAKIEMAERFGVEITELVDGVSKLDKLRFSSNEIAQAESFRKMLLAMSRDVRVIFVKLADRLHNLRTLGVMRPDKRRRIAKETLEIYVPIAHRLGLNTVFRELQELSFFNHYPRRYEVLRENVILTRGNRKAVLERILRETRTALPKSGIIAQVQGRDKTIYGIYNRMRDTHASFSDVLDIYGFRVIVRTREECYLTLCALHQLYKPVHNRFKDFIAIPKANGYRSLHTTVIGPYGTPVEYQIRTEEMHRIDEMGILSHWIYNDAMDTTGIQNMVKSWLQSLMEIQRTSADSKEFLENIKIDLFPDRVYVFTPRSKIVSLPQGSCPVDFAYQIHTDVGNKAIGCRINGENQPLSTVLKNGDMVEIITAPDAEPDPQWISFVRSGKARAEVRQYLRTRNAEESEALGRKVLAKAAKLAHLDLDAVPDNVWREVLKDASIASLEQLHVDIGLGHLPATGIVGQIKTLLQEHKTDRTSSEAAVTIRGTEGMAVQLATCCHPVPGDCIWGFMRKGHGLSVHRADCEHVARGRQNAPQRWMALAWQSDNPEDSRFAVPLDLEVTDDRAALPSIAAELSASGSSIVGMDVGANPSGHDKLNLMILVKSRLHLMHIMRALKRIPTVLNIARRLDGDKRLQLPSED